MSTRIDTENLDYFEIERQARMLRAQAARDGLAALVAWFRARTATRHTARTA